MQLPEYADLRWILHLEKNGPLSKVQIIDGEAPFSARSTFSGGQECHIWVYPCICHSPSASPVYKLVPSSCVQKHLPL